MKLSDFYDVEDQRFVSLYKQLKLKDQNLLHMFYPKNIYKFFFTNRIGNFSVSVALLLVVLESFVYFNMNSKMFTALPFVDLIKILIPSEIGLLIFLGITFAVFLRLLSKSEILKAININNKSEYLVDLIFSFYYIAALIGLTILLLIVTYFIIYLLIVGLFLHKYWIFLILSLVDTFLVIYTLVYSISLLGTCIRMFLLTEN